MIVDVALYEDRQDQDPQDQDVRREQVSDLDDALARLRSPGGGHRFLWIALHDPDADELSSIARTLDLHRLAVEDAVTGHQRPKIETYGDTVFVVLKPLEYFDDDSTVETGELLLFVGPDFLVSVRRGDVGSLVAVRSAVQQDPHELHRGPKGVLHAILEHVVAGYTRIDSELEQDVEEVEEQVFSPTRTSDAQRIYSLKREVLEVRRAAVPLVAPLTHLVHGDAKDGTPQGAHGLDQQATFVLRDVLDNLVRTVEHVEGYDRQLTDILNAHLAQVSVRQNDDMRKISAWAAIAAVPTLVAGVYGMNFQHMPELSWRFGYPACLLVMVAICVGLYRVFRRSGWL